MRDREQDALAASSPAERERAERAAARAKLEAIQAEALARRAGSGDPGDPGASTRIGSRVSVHA